MCNQINELCVVWLECTNHTLGKKGVLVPLMRVLLYLCNIFDTMLRQYDILRIKKQLNKLNNIYIIVN